MNTQTQSKLEIIALIEIIGLIIGIVANMATIVTFILPFFTSIQTVDPNWSVPQTNYLTMQTSTFVNTLKVISFFSTWFILSLVLVRQSSTSNSHTAKFDFNNKIYGVVVGVGFPAFFLYCLLLGPLARKLWLDFNNLQPPRNETEKLLDLYINPHHKPIG